MPTLWLTLRIFLKWLLWTLPQVTGRFPSMKKFKRNQLWQVHLAFSNLWSMLMDIVWRPAQNSDDIVILSHDHLGHLKSVFTTLKEAGLILNWRQKTTTRSQKLENINNCKKSYTEVLAFLRLTGYYRKLMQTMQPLLLLSQISQWISW